MLAAIKRGKGTAAARPPGRVSEKIVHGHRPLIPRAGGSGNFLYVSLQMLLDLEKEIINFAAQLGFHFDVKWMSQQLRAIEINPYAFELAQVSVQIGPSGHGLPIVHNAVQNPKRFLTRRMRPAILGFRALQEPMVNRNWV